VNNAGILSAASHGTNSRKKRSPATSISNYLGYFLVTKAFYPLILKSKTPRVIMVASRTYFLANPGQMAYVASKGAVMGMTRVLAKEMGEQNIPVNAVMPGMVRNTRHHAAFSGRGIQPRHGNQAIKKRVTPEHLAGLIAFLASDDAELITGQMISATAAATSTRRLM